MKSKELEIEMDVMSEEFRLYCQSMSDYLNNEDPAGELDVYLEMEDTMDIMQERLAQLHQKLGMAYRLEELDEECDCDHSLVLSTVYN